MRSPPLLSSLVTLVALATGCQTQMYARGTFVTPAPTPVVRGDAHVNVDIRIDFFGVPLGGAQDLVFVLDHSGSMGMVSAGFAGQDVGMTKTGAALTGIAATLVNAKTKTLPSKMEVAKAELERTLSLLPDGTRFMIIFFDDEIAAFTPYMVTLDPQSRAAAIGFVRRIKPGGSTAAVPALRLAYEQGARRIVLLSDGLANTGGSGSDLLGEARMWMQRGVRFDTVGLGIDQDAALMTTLAAESGGLAMKR
jgi:hypothetical protein